MAVKSSTAMMLSAAAAEAGSGGVNKRGRPSIDPTTKLITAVDRVNDDSIERLADLTDPFEYLFASPLNLPITVIDEVWDFIVGSGRNHFSLKKLLPAQCVLGTKFNLHPDTHVCMYVCGCSSGWIVVHFRVRLLCVRSRSYLHAQHVYGKL